MKSPILSISHFLPPKPLSFWPHSVVLLSFQALKKATKVKKNLQRTLSKKVSEKPTNSIRKSKKTRQSTRFGHYHRLNETLRQNDPEQNPQLPVLGEFIYNPGVRNTCHLLVWRVKQVHTCKGLLTEPGTK